MSTTKLHFNLDDGIYMFEMTRHYLAMVHLVEGNLWKKFGHIDNVREIMIKYTDALQLAKNESKREGKKLYPLPRVDIANRQMSFGIPGHHGAALFLHFLRGDDEGLVEFELIIPKEREIKLPQQNQPVWNALLMISGQTHDWLVVNWDILSGFKKHFQKISKDFGQSDIKSCLPPLLISDGKSKEIMENYLEILDETFN